METKESLNNSQTADSQVEDAEIRHGTEIISYDANGLSGIVRSPYVLGAAALASFGGFSFGYDQGVISIILVMKQFHEAFPETAPGAAHYGFNVGFMTGMLELGAFIGCLFLPYLADRISRKWSLTVATGFFCVGAVIQTAANNYGTLVAGRTIGGIGVGTLAMGAPLYISEIAPPNLRGSLLVLEAISIVIGAIIAYWITYGTRDIAGEWSWRLPFLLQMVPALLVGGGIHFFPYSPRWLAMRGRDDDSLQSLSKLRRVPVTDSRVQAEWKGILSEVRFQEEIIRMEHPTDNALKAELAQWLDLFKPKYLKRTAIALGIPFFQQFSGINAFVYYAPTFFAALGQDSEMALILSGMVNICQLVAGIPTFLFLDQFGRRKLAIGGGIAMAIPHLIMAGVVSKYQGKWDDHKAMGWFGVALIYIYVLCYAVSYGPLAWTLPAEVFPSSKRAKGVGAATATIWIANFIIGVVVPEMMIKLGWGTYLFFGLFCVAAAVFSFFLVPETSKKSLEQISELFGDGGTPCASCSRTSASCVRAAKKFRVKRLITSHGNFKFDPNQTWIQTGSQDQKQHPFSIIHESDGPSARSRGQISLRDELEESCLNAAELLQSFSRGDRSAPSQDTASSSALDQLKSPNAIHSDGQLESSSMGDGISPDTLANLSTPTSSIFNQTTIPPFHEPDRVIPQHFHPVWQQRCSGSSSAESPGQASSYTSSPRQPDMMHRSVPTDTISDQGTPSSVLGSRNGGSGTPSLDFQEGCLVRCFIEKLATSFDTSDRDHHYLNVVPIRAMYSPLLLNAICTASARFLTQIRSRRDPSSVVDYNGIQLPNLTEESAIHYHNKCISYLMDVSADPSNSCSDDALTAITILRYHEQVDTHFTGIDSEIFSIAVQAAFQAQQDRSFGQWRLTLQPPRDRDMFAVSMPSLRHSACLIALRQEIWSVLIHQRPFRLPIFTVGDYANFDDTSKLDDHDWTNCVIFWCAHVLKFCFSDENFLTVEDKRTRLEQWNALKAFEKNWDERTPAHFAPLYYNERNPSEGRYFPTIWLANQTQVMALQHVELARIVLAVHDLKLQRIGIGASAAYQALEEVLRQSTRRICALGLSDLKFQAALVTAGVGVSMCGEYFHDPGEQAAIIDVMTTLENEHAWPTSAAVGALQTAWNEYRARDT
ncbi:hypothetical protein B0J13DRAFT_677587 [Dactylonectria estremocensis]|uniref:Major facilitator superfamily (MFS) profile domain-containing protein n=1 Tax=Dactylonectria estremocensis TaxID=1079267 RepID=A0A9P9EFZ3_9HYPO|nr:hypothetical protein B0J13DRAFT_677587 [Dactylonectria estremocensis]